MQGILVESRRRAWRCWTVSASLRFLGSLRRGRRVLYIVCVSLEYTEEGRRGGEEVGGGGGDSLDGCRGFVKVIHKNMMIEHEIVMY